MNLLNRFVQNPERIRRWQADDWNRFLPLARRARLLGRSYHLLQQHGLLDAAPQRVVDQLIGGLAQTRYVQTQALRELRHVSRVLGEVGIPIIALKGVAYLVAGLPPSAWRNLADIDVMVPLAKLSDAEQALSAAGWVVKGEFDDYDQAYYRNWMHEIPPLQHRGRAMEVDVHHNLAPPVSRSKIDAARLWANAYEPRQSLLQGIHLLCPADMLLHNALHLYMNDELRGGIRDVVDFRDLFEHFHQADPAFSEELVRRAAELNCGRPLYYAVTSCKRLAGLSVPATLERDIGQYAPAQPFRSIMAWLIEQALSPDHLGSYRAAVALKVLYTRSHWVRMPPLMLAVHLIRKALRRQARPSTEEPELPG